MSTDVFGKTVLLIDDDQRFRMLISTALEQKGYRVIKAASGREGALEVKSTIPDLVIIDGQLPDMQGQDWITSLRRFVIKTPVLFVSGYCRDTVSYCHLTKDLGVAAVLHKPVLPAVLCDEVDRVLGVLREESQLGADSLFFDDDMEALSLEYASELPVKVREIGAVVSELRHRPNDQALLGAGKICAHKIHGTAGIYGFPKLGAQAGVIEDCLGRLTPGEILECGPLWRELEQALSLAEIYADQAAVDGQDRVGSDGQAQEVGHTHVLPSGRTGRPTVLIVDDDADFTRKVSVVLGYEGMVVHAFTESHFILEVLDRLEPELLLLDANMPDTDGFELCRKIRQSGRWYSLPIVFVTARVGWEDRVKAFESGADDYIAKPVINEELIARVKTRIERARLLQDLAERDQLNNLLFKCLLVKTAQPIESEWVVTRIA